MKKNRPSPVLLVGIALVALGTWSAEVIPDDIIAAIEELGYSAELASDQEAET